MERINLIDLDFNSFSQDEKRIAFMIMDIMLKKLHDNNKVVVSFNPSDIYYDKESSVFVFDKVEKLTPYFANTKEEAILKNIISLSTLAFCSYLKAYDIKSGLLSSKVISNEFDKFENIFNQDDVNYYRNVLVDGVSKEVLPKPIYYYEYVKNKETQRNATNSMSYIKATEVGKLMTDRENQEAFVGQFFLVSMTASLILFVCGYILYILNLI